MALTDKYVTTTGAGAHDGSSEANAWTLAEAITNEANGNLVNIKADATYTISSDQTLGAGAVGAPRIWRGYTSTIGDGGKATIQWSHESGGSAVFTVGAYRYFQDLIIQRSGTNACVRVFYASGGPSHWFRCKVYAPDLANDDAFFVGQATISQCVIEGRVRVWYSTVAYCRIKSGQDGINSADDGKNFIGNLIIRDGTAGNAGIQCDWSAARGEIITLNTIYGFQHGIQSADAPGAVLCIIANNLFYNLSGYGINYDDTASDTHPYCINNAFGSCTSGYFNGVNTAYQIGSIEDISDPFVSAGTDFRLNNTAGGGALCRGVGAPTDIDMDTTQDNWLDLGALQAEPTGGDTWPYIRPQRIL